MFKVSRSNSVSSEEAPSSPESISDSSPQPSPGPHTDSVFEEDQPQYSPAYRPDSNGSASFSPSHYDYHSESSSPEPGNFDDEDDPFGCQEDFVKAVRRGDSRNLKRILSRYSQLIQINRLTTDGQTALTPELFGRQPGGGEGAGGARGQRGPDQQRRVLSTSRRVLHRTNGSA